MENQLLQKIREVFPNISTVFALAEMDECGNDVDAVVHKLLSTNGEYPREDRWHTPDKASDKVERNIKDFDTDVSNNDKIVGMTWLSNKYKEIPIDFIAHQARRFRYHLFPTAYYLDANLHFAKDGTIFFENQDVISRLPYPRSKLVPMVKISNEMEWEIKAVENFLDVTRRRRDALFAGEDLVKCAKCGESYLFEEFVTCSDGCLVCEECLNKHLLRLLFSKKEISLECISVQGCGGKGYYTDPTVKRALKYDPEAKTLLDVRMMEAEREREEAVNRQRNEAAVLAIFPRRAEVLNTKLTVLLPTDERYQFVHKHFSSTPAGQVRAILGVDRAEEAVRFAPYANSPSRYLLYHGTPEGPVVPILNTGLYCNCRGMCFFGSSASVSNGYSRKGGAQNQYYMFWAEVHGANPANVGGEQVSAGLVIPPPNGAYTVGVPAQIRLRYLIIFA